MMLVITIECEDTLDAWCLVQSLIEAAESDLESMPQCSKLSLSQARSVSNQILAARPATEFTGLIRRMDALEAQLKERLP